MEVWQLALLAWEGLKLLGVLVGAVPTTGLVPDATCWQARIGEGALFCPRDIVGYTLAEEAEHWMVRHHR